MTYYEVLACVVVIQLIVIGWYGREFGGFQAGSMLLGASVILMAMWGGVYWNLFGRGHGWFTTNRLTALAFYVLLLIGPSVWARFRRRRA